MLEKLYQLGCLDYNKLIRKYYKRLNLSEVDCLVLISILDNYNDTQSIVVNNIVKESSYTISDVENTMSVLLENDYIEIYLNILPDGKQSEAYRITPFFKVLEKLVKNNEVNENDMAKVIGVIEDKVKRLLTTNELETITSWFSDGQTLTKILDVIEELEDTSIVSVKNIEKKLYKVKTKVQTGDAIKKAFEMIGKK